MDVNYKPRVKSEENGSSVYINSSPFVNQILKQTPGNYISEPFAHDPRCEASEVANETIVFVYLNKRRVNTLIMLCLIFVVILKECSRSYDV